mgnify:CR=1 FL=1
MRPGYKQTEVGVIPEDWEVKSLGSFGDFSKGRGIRKDEAQSGDLPCVRYGEIYTHHNDIIRECNSRISQSVAKTAKVLKHGDVLFAGSGETKEEIGKAVAFVSFDEAYAGGDIIIFSPHNSSSEFLGYLLNAPYVTRQKASKGQGDAIVHISANALASIILSVPPLSEQRAIATALSDVDALLDGLDRLIAKKRNIKQAAMQQLLTGKTRLPGFTGEWEVKRLGEVAETDPENLGSSIKPSYTFNYIALENVNCGCLEGYSEVTYSMAPSRARRKLQEGDILIATVRPSLKAHLLFKGFTGEWVCSTGFCVIRCRQKSSNPEYLIQHFFSHTINKQIEELIAGSNYPAINNKDVRALVVIVPPYEEQTAIAAILSDMDAEIAALEARRNKTRNLKQAMMQELLTGRTRLNN